MNIYDTANQLERDVRELAEFKALEQAYNELKAQEESFQLFKDFQNLQVSLQQKQMQGEEFTEDDAKQMQEIAEKIQNDDAITNMLQKEQALSIIMNDITAIMMKPVQDLYGF
ncbi:YlbF family regulator [Catellicoccus marimammalium]|uniref:UPF0342 protein C683_0530 n=1 Tax=Catellicoccus marimammalium M35/04/3 TaxID=1234409 RepID=K8ZPR4_9ENTE|nr:YlbF family regulator [Catellicoccus marimammalium]EKU27536.1 hypothetical protein C683_0530 [Catellicoccus marimammalium M35/04/3]